MENSELRKYPPIVVLEENDGKVYYRASFREFPDMIGGIGDTVEEAISSAYGMLEAEIEFREEESLPIPNPIVAPLVNEASGRVTLRMSKSLHRQVIVIAEGEGISLNSYINEAISYYVGNRHDRKSQKTTHHFEKMIDTVLAWDLANQRFDAFEDRGTIFEQNQSSKARA